MTAPISRYDNVKTSVSSGTLTITICVDESKVNVQPSSTGKTLVVATTGGAAKINGTPLRLNLTLYRKP